MLPEYELRRSKRRTLSIKVNRDAKLIVYAPRLMPLWQINDFVNSHVEWIKEKQKKAEDKKISEPPEEEVMLLREKARNVLESMTAYYAEKMGVTYSKVGITSARGRFGSCSKKGNINYSWRLMLYPEKTWDYVVVHELCHLLHFDHSNAFWQEVEKVLPDYKERKAMLK